MAEFPSAFAFYFGGPSAEEDANGCWIGIPTPIETKLATPFNSPVLELLRATFIRSVVSVPDAAQGARAILQMSFETEVGTILVKLVDLVPGVLSSTVCPRRHFLDVDLAVRANRHLLEPALAALGGLASPVPDVYVQFIRRHLAADYARYRVCAVAALLVLAAALS